MLVAITILAGAPPRPDEPGFKRIVPFGDASTEGHVS